MTGCTSGEYGQFETSPEAIEQELRPAAGNVDRFKANYRIDVYRRIQWVACRGSVYMKGCTLIYYVGLHRIKHNVLWTKLALREG